MAQEFIGQLSDLGTKLLNSKAEMAAVSMGDQLLPTNIIFERNSPTCSTGLASRLGATGGGGAEAYGHCQGHNLWENMVVSFILISFWIILISAILSQQLHEIWWSKLCWCHNFPETNCSKWWSSWPFRLLTNAWNTGSGLPQVLALLVKYLGILQNDFRWHCWAEFYCWRRAWKQHSKEALGKQRHRWSGWHRHLAVAKGSSMTNSAIPPVSHA